MSTDSASPRQLVSVPTEGEAALIVAALEERGVRAKSVGEHTSGFKSSAPGDVTIFVDSIQIDRAQKALDEMRRHQSDIDWSKVDVGRPEAEIERGPCTPVSSSSQEHAKHPSDVEPAAHLLVRGRLIFFTLLAIEVLFHLWTMSQFGSSSPWLSTLLMFGLFYALWYACWRGYRWAINLFMVLAALVAVSGCFPPYTINGRSLLPATVFYGIVAVMFLWSTSLKEFFRYQRMRRTKS